MRENGKLLIVQDNWKWDDQEQKHELKNPLYTECYIDGLKCIFKQAIETDAWVKDNKGRIIRDERCNILSFIGKRGSGKSTAMDEFCRILRSMNHEEDYEWWLKKVMTGEEQKFLSEKKFHFHILDPIDASLFDAQEDLFEQVIVNIYRHFKKNIEDNRSEIMQQFTQIMKQYYSIRDSRENKTSDFSFAYMMNFSSDNQITQKKIAELIDYLFAYDKNDDYDKTDYEHVVITIDDLDLNILNGYQMIEQIQKYFAYHKIILLISMDFEQMRQVCEQHFSSQLGGIGKINSGRTYEQYIRTLSKDVMAKMFHMSQRIYMPDFERILKNTYIVIDEKVEKLDDGGLRIKEYLLGKIAGRMQIYYDDCGMKKHFAEANTVRELVVYNEFLDSLKYLDFSERRILLYEQTNDENENSDILKAYDLNYRRFIDDITERMAQDVLTPEQRIAFHSLMSRDLERRARYFVNSYRAFDDIAFGDIDKDGKNDVTEVNKDSRITDMQYSYGQLLEHIYTWGRNSQRGYFEDKPYMWCILASFTTEMTREYMHYCYNPDDTRRNKKYKRRILGFLGKNFGNKWLGEAFPKYKKNTLGVNEMNSGGFAKATPGLLMIWLNLDGMKNAESFETWVEENYYIETMEMLNMLFSYIDNEKIRGLEFELEDKNNSGKDVRRDVDKDEKEDVLAPHIKARDSGRIKFDAMTFVLRSLDYRSAEEEIIENITTVLYSIQEKYWEKEHVSENKLKKHVSDMLVLRADYEKTKRKVAFPFYNLDMSYNICKRLRNEFKNDKEKASLAEALKSSYDEIYKFLVEERKGYIEISECLLKEEMVYSNINKNFDYLDQFENCPFIRTVRSQTMKVKNCENLDEIERDKQEHEKYRIVMGKVEELVNSMTVEDESTNDAEKGNQARKVLEKSEQGKKELEKKEIDE